MFDKSKLKTSGMITIPVEHPRTSKVYNLEFSVAAKHEQALLGFTACRALKLLRVVEENICEIATATATSSQQPKRPSKQPPKAAATECVTEAEILSEYADLFDGVGLLEGDVH